MEEVTSLISAGADVNDVDEVRHGVCSVSPHTCVMSMHLT